MKRCPFCAEEIQDAALVCRYCKRELGEVKATQQPAPTPPPKELPWHRRNPGCAAVVVVSICILILIFFGLVLGGSGRSRPARGERTPRLVSTPTLRAIYASPYGRLYSGAKLYVGTKAGTKTLAGTILGGNNRYRDPSTGQSYRAVKIAYESGRIGWVRRDSLKAATFWVRLDDPALEAGAWKLIPQ